MDWMKQAFGLGAAQGLNVQVKPKQMKGISLTFYIMSLAH